MVKELANELGTKGTDWNINPDSDAESWKITVAGSDKQYTLAKIGTVTTGDKSKGVKIEDLQTSTTKPYLPSSSFSISENENEQTVDGGLVITDGENAFVWIEVPRTLKDSETGEGVYETITDLNKTTLSNDDYEAIAKDLANYSNSSLKSQTTLAGHLPPAADVGNVDYTDTYKEVLKSIYQNGGFYIGRYETGIKGTEKTTECVREFGNYYSTLHETAENVAVIKQNVQPYNWVRWGQAIELAQGISEGKKGTNKTNLPIGVQWDLVLKFLQEKNAVTSAQISSSTDWGNYRDSEFDIEQGKYVIFKDDYTLNSTWTNGDTENYVTSGKKVKNTGYSDRKGVILTTTGANTTNNCKKNIYDLAGNLYEWTIENTALTNLPCAGRGGGFDFTGSDCSVPSCNSRSTTLSLYNYRFSCLTLLSRSIES